jgi:hypothetical protein
MIPAKLFLQTIHNNTIQHKLTYNIILNNIFYDHIKLFQTKYLCLTSNDQLAIEVQSNEGELMGTTII